MLTLLGMIFFASSTDVMANFFSLPLKAVLWFFRIAVIVAPIIAYFVTYKICLEMQDAEGIGKRKRAKVVLAVGDRRVHDGRLRTTSRRRPRGARGGTGARPTSTWCRPSWPPARASAG